MASPNLVNIHDRLLLLVPRSDIPVDVKEELVALAVGVESVRRDVVRVLADAALLLSWGVSK